MLVTLNKNWRGARAGLTVQLEINVARSLIKQGIASDPNDVPASKDVTAPKENKMVTAPSAQKSDPVSCVGTGPGAGVSFPSVSRSPRFKIPKPK